MLRLLIAEDSVTVRELLILMFEEAGDFEIVGTATSGEEAIEMTRRLRPDVITMDVHMPGMDGLDATSAIMSETPTPIVIVSGQRDAAESTFSVRCLGAGALAVCPKPGGPAHPDFESESGHIVSTARLMAGVSVVRRRGPLPSARAAPQIRPADRPQASRSMCPKLVGIVTSTGGPQALQTILSRLPASFPAPVLIVQHLTSGFLGGLVSWLDSISALTVRVARHGELLSPGVVYLAAEDHHIGASAQGTAVLSDDPAIAQFRPAGTYLFDSLAQAYGAAALGIILTGMGRDGVDGLRALRRAGGAIIAQDEASSVVFGMPAVAIQEGLADWILPLDDIAGALARLGRPEEHR